MTPAHINPQYLESLSIENARILMIMLSTRFAHSETESVSEPVSIANSVTEIIYCELYDYDLNPHDIHAVY